LVENIANAWEESLDPTFVELCHKSFLPKKWISYQSISRNIFDQLPLKPINRYAEFLHKMPELISINNNTITLRQKTHAEIFILNENNSFKNIDRPWMRQYYKTAKKYSEDQTCFEPAYIFYVPWAIDDEVSATFSESPDSPFKIYESTQKYLPIDPSSEYIEPLFVPFKFKKTGTHIKTPEFGRIKGGSPMFDISFVASDILIERVKEFYERY
jgi:hypothetical protein